MIDHFLQYPGTGSLWGLGLGISMIVVQDDSTNNNRPVVQILYLNEISTLPPGCATPPHCLKVWTRCHIT